MERVILEQTGWDAPLRYERTLDPPRPPGRGQVAIAVGACGVAHRDLIDRSGRMKFMALPIVQGHEFAGRVIAVGEGVTQWSVGDTVGALHRDSCGRCPRCLEGESGHCGFATHVFGAIADGGYASHVTAPERAFFAVPASMPVAHAAILNSTFGTAYRALHRFGTPSADDVVLVVGANGGVGIGAVQIAKRRGATVVAVVRSEEHRAFVTSLGADHVVVDAAGAFHRAMPTSPADYTIDCVGSPTFHASLRATRLGGALAIVGNVDPEPARMPMGRLVVGDVRICGSSGATPNDLAALLDLHAESPLAFHVAETLPLSEADAAQRRLRAGGLQGRLVLVPSNEG